MAFGQEVQDFLGAFTAVSNAFGTRASREGDRLDNEYRQAQIDKTRWDMGAEQRDINTNVNFESESPWGIPDSGAGGTLSGEAYTDALTGSAGHGADVNAIVQSAHRIGADPREYLAVMNYESGVNPNRWGGKNDSYFGLIQFGPAEREQFGARPGQSITEQLPAVEGYLKARGFKPGMGLGEMYSIINAGSLDDNGQPRWGKSDGAGTVRDHVAAIAEQHVPVATRILSAKYAGMGAGGAASEAADRLGAGGGADAVMGGTGSDTVGATLPVNTVDEAKSYLVDTATTSTSINRQGVPVAIGRLHPAFAVTLAKAIQTARAEGINAGAHSAFRDPVLDPGGYADKWNSLHGYGLATDVSGIGAAGSATSRRWYEIATAAGLYNPYGPDNGDEFNHYQAIPEKGEHYVAAHPEMKALLTSFRDAGSSAATPPDPRTRPDRSAPTDTAMYFSGKGPAEPTGVAGAYRPSPELVALWQASGLSLDGTGLVAGGSGRTTMLGGNVPNPHIRPDRSGPTDTAMYFSGGAGTAAAPAGEPVLTTPAINDRLDINLPEYQQYKQDNYGADGASDTVYTVRKGDTLSAIAGHFGLSDYADIVRVNGIRNPNKIKEGQQLIIPGVTNNIPTPNLRPSAGSPSTFPVRPGFPGGMPAAPAAPAAPADVQSGVPAAMTDPGISIQGEGAKADAAFAAIDQANSLSWSKRNAAHLTRGNPMASVSPAGVTPEIGNPNYPGELATARHPQTAGAVPGMPNGSGPYGAGVPAPLDSPTSQLLSPEEHTRIVEELNAFREKNGQPPLALPGSYDQVANLPPLNVGGPQQRTPWFGALGRTLDGMMTVPEPPQTELSLDAMPGSSEWTQGGSGQWMTPSPPTINTPNKDDLIGGANGDILGTPDITSEIDDVMRLIEKGRSASGLNPFTPDERAAVVAEQTAAIRHAYISGGLPDPGGPADMSVASPEAPVIGTVSRGADSKALVAPSTDTTSDVVEPAIPDTATPAPAPAPAPPRHKGGFDPLPQTSGHGDPVSQAGYESISPGHQIFPWMADRTPTKQIIRGGLKWGMKTFGLDQQGVDTQSESPQAEAFMSGHGGINIDLVSQLEEKIDPNNKMSTGERQAAVMNHLWKFYMYQGHPEKANALAFSVYQTYKAISQKYLALSQRDASEGDYESSMTNLLNAYSVVPDGISLNVDKLDDGSLQISSVNDENGKTISEFHVSAAQFPKFIMEKALNLGPGDFDTMVIASISGAAEQEANTFLENALGGGPVSPGDTGISETAAPAPNLAGGTSAPSLAGGTAAGSDAGIPTSDVVSAPAAATVAGAPEPQKPMPYPEFIKYVYSADVPDKARPALIENWKNQTSIWEAWNTANAKTAADAATAAVTSDFYTKLAAVDPSQPLNYDWTTLNNLPPGSEAVAKELRLAGDAHDAAAEGLRKEDVASSERGANMISTGVLNREIQKVQFDPQVGVAHPGDKVPTVGPFDAVLGGGVRRTSITGDIPAPAGEIGIPDQATLGQMTATDPNTLMSRIDATNTDIAKYNEQFAPAAPLDMAKPDVKAQQAQIVGEFKTQLVAAMNGKTPDPAKHLNSIVEGPGGADLLPVAHSAVMNILHTPGNTTMSLPLAVQSVLSMLTVDPANPEAIHIGARRVRNQPGIVEVFPLNSSGTQGTTNTVKMSEEMFVGLDQARAKIAADLLLERNTKSNQAAADQASTDQQIELGNQNLDKYQREQLRNVQPSFDALDELNRRSLR